MPGEEGSEATAPLAGGRLRLGQAAFASVYADGILAVLSIALIPYLIRGLGAEPYGILGIVTVLAGQLGVLHFGVGTAATRLVGESVGRGGEGLIARLTGVAVVGACASLLVGTVFLLLAPVVWQSGFKMSSDTLPLALTAVPAGAALVALTPAAAAMYGVLTARELFLFAAGLRLYQGAGRLLAAVVVVYLGRGVAEVFWAQAGVDLTAVLIGSAWSRKGAGPEPGPSPPGASGIRLLRTRDAVLTVLAVGLPFALVSLLSGLLTDVEKLAIALARSVEDFTYYAVPFNAVIKFTVLSGAVVRVLMPRVAALGARGGADEALQLTQRADRILVVGMVAVATPFVVLAPELLRLWVGDVFALRSTLATRILLVGIAVNAAAIPAHAVVLARGRPAYLTLLYAAEVALHLISVYLLVTAFGLVGAAVAWTVRVILDTLAQRMLAEHTLGLRFQDGLEVWGSVALLSLLVMLVTILSLPGRLAVGAIIGGMCVLRLARGHERRLLLDSLLPWRWGVGR